jgi:hypothetical protein
METIRATLGTHGEDKGDEGSRRHVDSLPEK